MRGFQETSLVVWATVVLVVAGFEGRRGFPADVAKEGAELRYEQPRYLTGTIYARDSGRGRPLFTFKRVATRSGSTLNVVREYAYPDGRPAARERVVYNGNNLVGYELEELQIGATGSAKIRHDPGNPAKGSIEFEYTSDVAAGSKPKTRSEPLRENTLLNDMVGPFLTSHWDALLRGDKVKCRYVVVPRRETVGFTFTRESESTFQGRPVVILRMEPGSRFVAALVEPLFFTVEKEQPHRVLQYVGRTTPKIESGGKWKDLDAVTVFDWK
jgi:hypothetical protein